MHLQCRGSSREFTSIHTQETMLRWALCRRVRGVVVPRVLFSSHTKVLHAVDPPCPAIQGTKKITYNGRFLLFALSN